MPYPYDRGEYAPAGAPLNLTRWGRYVSDRDGPKTAYFQCIFSSPTCWSSSPSGSALVALMIGLSSLLRPPNPEPGKLATYECGEPPTGSAWINFNIRFYLIALDLRDLRRRGRVHLPGGGRVPGLGADRATGSSRSPRSSIFVGILFVGLVYVWVKGDLEWLKQVPAAETASRRAMREAA